MLFIEGAVTYRSWEDQPGQKHSSAEIVAGELILLDRPSDPSPPPVGERGPSPARRDSGGASEQVKGLFASLRFGDRPVRIECEQAGVQLFATAVR